MKKYKKILCVALSLVLLWNSASYLVNAQEATVPVQNEMEPVEEELGEEVEPEAGNLGDVAPEDEITIKETEDVYIKDLLVEVDCAKRAFKLAWSKEESVEYDAVEVVLYTKEDKSDEEPIIVEVAEGDEILLNDENIENGLFEGTAYYIDVKAYKLSEEEKVYGKPLSTVAILLSTPVVTATAGDAQYDLTWTEVSGATSYEIYNTDTNEVIQTVSTNSATVTELKNDMQYNVQVKAIAEIVEEEEIKYIYESVSDIVSVKPMTRVVGRTTLTYTPHNLGARLKWTEVDGATSYIVYRYAFKTKKWTKVKELTGTSYTDTGLQNGQKYYYKIATVRTSGGSRVVGAYSKWLTVTAKKYVTGSVHPMYYGARCIKTCPMYTTSTSTKSVGKLKKGTKVTVISTSVGKRTLIQLSNGKKYYISKGRLYYNSCKYTTLDYTTEDKENFINSKGYWSKTGYLIWISSYTQKVNIFKGSQGNWKLYKTYKCATGKATTRTIRGTYRINSKASRYGGRTYEKWVSFFYGVNSFHSRLYRGGRIVDATIGRPASNGCIRMYTSECYWIYKNIPKQTCVVSY